jgi:hypothetical protein
MHGDLLKPDDASPADVVTVPRGMGGRQCSLDR